MRDNPSRSCRSLWQWRHVTAPQQRGGRVPVRKDNRSSAAGVSWKTTGTAPCSTRYAVIRLATTRTRKGESPVVALVTTPSQIGVKLPKDAMQVVDHTAPTTPRFGHRVGRHCPPLIHHSSTPICRESLRGRDGARGPWMARRCCGARPRVLTLAPSMWVECSASRAGAKSDPLAIHAGSPGAPPWPGHGVRGRWTAQGEVSSAPTEAIPPSLWLGAYA